MTKQEELNKRVKEFRDKLEKTKIKIPPDLKEESRAFFDSCLTSYDPVEAANYVANNSAFIGRYLENADSLQEAFLLGFLLAFGVSTKIASIKEFEDELMAELMVKRLNKLFEGLPQHAPIDDGQLPS